MSIVVTVLLALAANECSDVSPWLAKKLVRWAAHRLYPDPNRAATRSEELAALINDVPGKLLKLLTALGFGTRAIYAAIHSQAKARSAVIREYTASVVLVVLRVFEFAFFVVYTGSLAVQSIYYAMPIRVAFVVAAIGFFIAIPVFVFATREGLSRAAAQGTAIAVLFEFGIAVLFEFGWVIAVSIYDSELSVGVIIIILCFAIEVIVTAWVTRLARARVLEHRLRVRARGIA